MLGNKNKNILGYCKIKKLKSYQEQLMTISGRQFMYNNPQDEREKLFNILDMVEYNREIEKEIARRRKVDSIGPMLNTPGQLLVG